MTPAPSITVGTVADEQQAIADALATPVVAPVARYWAYSQPGLVLGRGQKPDEALKARARDEGLDLVQRHTGGGVVLAGDWLMSQFVVLPPQHPLSRQSLPDSFETIGGAWRRALARLGVTATMVPRNGLREQAAAVRKSDIGWVCFAGASFGELTDARGGKLLGLAQVRRKTGVVIVAGLLLARTPWETLVRVWLGDDDAALSGRIEGGTATCQDLASAGWSGDAEAIARTVSEEMGDLNALASG